MGCFNWTHSLVGARVVNFSRSCCHYRLARPPSPQEKAGAEKKAAEETEREKEEAASATSDKIGEFFSNVFDKLPFLQPLQPTVQPALDFLADRPYLLYAVAGLPALGLLFTICSALFGGKKVSAGTYVAFRKYCGRYTTHRCHPAFFLSIRNRHGN